MFSIVIPLYNKEKYVREALLSILNQTRDDFELIIVNDGSTDNSLEVIRPFLEDKRVVLVNQENQGVSAARNKGILTARYDYITFLDADDLWHPQYLEIMHEALLQLPEASIITADHIRVPASFKLENLPQYAFGEYEMMDDYFSYAYKNTIFSSSSTVVRKAVFEKVTPFNIMITSGEDLDLWFRIMIHFRGARLPQKLAFYRSPEGATASTISLPPMEKHLIAHMLQWYEPYRKQDNQVLNDFMYHFVLNATLHFYFAPGHHAKAKALIRSIPLKYKLGKIRFWIYLFPYFLSEKVYTYVMSGKDDL